MPSEASRKADLRPISLTSQEEFVVALHRLRERSGLTYKEIERLTLNQGPYGLPASTLATALQRRTAPRPDVVAALVYACGGDADVVDEWLALREALVHPGDARAHPDEDPRPLDGPPEPLVTTHPSPTAALAPAQRWRRPRVLCGLAALLGLLALGTATIALKPSASPGDSGHRALREPAAPSPDAATLTGLPSANSYVLKIGGLCPSEKSANDSTGLVYLLPCDRTFPPRRLMRYGEGLWRVNTQHPEFGPGCMGIVSGSPQSGAAVSDDTCDRIQTDRFMLRRTSGGYQLLPEGHDLCVGTRGAPREGSPLLQLPCDPHSPGQEFTIHPA